MKRIRNKIIAVLLSLILVSITVIPQSQPKEVKAEMALPFLAGGALTLGEMAYGVLVGAGITAVTPDLVNDVFFQDRYSINSMIERGILTPVAGGNAEDLNDYNWDTVLQEIEDKTNSGESKFFKNVVKPVFSNYQPPSGGDPDWKKKLREWYVILGTTAALNGSLYGGMLQPLSTAVQQWAQPQVEYSMPANLSIDENLLSGLALANSNFNDALSYVGYYGYTNSYPIGLKGRIIPIYKGELPILLNYADGSYFCGKIASSDSFVSSSYVQVSSGNSSMQSGYNKFLFNGKQFFYSGIRDGTGNSDDTKFFYNYFGNPLLFNSLDDAASYYENNSDLIGQNYAPDLVNQDGNVYNITNINPIIQPNQTMQIPTKDMINNYINNYYNTTNQGDVINNYNDFINNLIQETPVSTPSPIPIPTTQPLPDLTPLPTPDPEDENSKYLSPNLKDYFPFCIPWDIADIFQNFTAERKAPKFVFPLKSERFGIDEEIVVDLSQFDDVAAILRALELILFVIGLAVATRALIGALS